MLTRKGEVLSMFADDGTPLWEVAHEGDLSRGAVDSMIRQQRRRIERQWSKIKVGAVCTDFIERNGLFSPPYVVAYQAVKVSEELIWV